MKMRLTNFSKSLRTPLKAIGQEADKQGVSVYIVGGIVRDLLLRKRNLDLDIVIEGNAIAFAEKFARKQSARVKPYTQFGTATIYLTNGLSIDVAMARKEVYHRPGALPSVTPGSIEEDLIRRDFTINAMAVKINANCFGKLFDPFGGQKDLTLKKIRILHEKSFIDDPTRILRGVRFEQRFRFLFDTKTLQLLKQALQRNAVKTVKPARYFEEFRKLLKEEYPRPALLRLKKLNGFTFLAKNFNVNAPLLGRMEKNIDRLKRDGFYRQKEWSLVYLVALLKGLDAKEMNSIIKYFQLTNHEKKVLLMSPLSDEVFLKLRRGGASAHKIFQILEICEEEIIFFIRVQTSAIIITRYVDHFLKKSSCITLNMNGNDLKKMGSPSGPKIGRVLRALLMMKIDGQLPSRQSELAMARQLLN
ncbi:MAG: CCA tRNA nucleotidyltransferase [Candidatus Omnitrophica bacterium]|nr:CCA tRNA nucleotidyltransferase [Candidatus Omnitrophota bacterium]